ncbi:MAG: type II secretion system protein [Verrucomicrobiales bacterium]
MSLVEALLVIAVLGIAAAMGVTGIGEWRRGVVETKAESDVETINRAIQSYLGFNGSVEGCESVEDVLLKLKSTADLSSAHRMLGITGSFVDGRIRPVYYEGGELSDGMPRIRWNGKEQRLELARDGYGNIKGFALDDYGGSDPPGEAREAFLDLAQSDGWIWDYTESDPVVLAPNPSAPTHEVPDSSPPPADPLPPEPEIEPLETPIFSIPSTTRPYTDYDLGLALSNPNPKGSSSIYYSADYGAWELYNDSLISVEPDSVIQAQAIAEDRSRYSNSAVGQESYRASPIQLLPPEIDSSAPKFDVPDAEVVEISLENPNEADVSSLEYRLNGGAWQVYGGPFTVTYASYPDGVDVEAKAVGTSKYYEDSVVSILRVGAGPRKLDSPVIHFSRDYFSDDKDDPVTVISVDIENPNPEGSSVVRYEIFPVPGGSGTRTDYQDYTGPFQVYRFVYPSGFGVRAYAKALSSEYFDSDSTVRFATKEEGLFGGHLDLDTSNFLAAVGSGDTSAHTHDITGKHNLTGIDFFAIPEEKQIEINEAITDSGQKFKLLLVNGDLSPGMRVVIHKESDGVAQRTSSSAETYDDTPIDSLTVLSLGGGTGAAKLTGLELQFDKDVILHAEIIPTNTGDVKDNEPGKLREWRNGALTLQAVEVDSDGTDAFTTEEDMSAGDHDAAASGLLWEAAVFWHWGGDSYHEEKNQYQPRKFSSISDEVDSELHEGYEDEEGDGDGDG